MESREGTEKRQAVRRVLIDNSHTINSGLNTGIQRVVRKLAEFLPQVGEAEEIECCSVVYRDGCFQYSEQQNGWVSLDHRSLRVKLVDSLPASYRRAASWLCASRATSGLKRWLLPKRGSLGLFYLPAKLGSGCTAPLRWMTRGRRRVNFAEGDVLLMPDGYWAFSKIWPGVALAKEQGASVAVIVYDVICLQHPEFFAAGADEKFASYLGHTFKHADQIVAISRTVEDEVRQLLEKNPPPLTKLPDVGHFRLGADIVEQVGEPRAKIRRIFGAGKRDTYVVVSTLEPRKNHALVLDAFDALWKDHDVQLLLIGRRGWMCDQLIERMAGHAEYRTRLFWISDVDDCELSYCYSHAAAVICPSLAEGFGLPIVEALWHDKITLASDIPIHHEVGGTACRYFAKDDCGQLARLLRDVQSVAQENESAAKPEILDWQNSAQQLLAILKQVGNTTPSKERGPEN